MGTKSLTTFLDEWDNEEIVVMYRQYDGYPEGLGLELAEFLSEFTMVNGLGADSYRARIANGVGCLAAQLVQHLKDGPGNVYLETLNGNPGDSWEEYIYTLYPKEGEPTFISIYDVFGEECVFVGTSKDLQTKYDD